MRNAIILAAACFAVVANSVAPAEDPAPMSDQENIQGTWRLLGGERQGKPFPEDLLGNVTLTFSGDKMATKNKDKVSEFRFKLDPTTSPRSIDVDMEGNVGEGIYEILDDTLRIIHGEVGDPRPTSFDPKKSATSTYMLLERVGRPQK